MRSKLFYGGEYRRIEAEIKKLLRAYPNNPAQRYVMMAQTKWSNPK